MFHWNLVTLVDNNINNIHNSLWSHQYVIRTTCKVDFKSEKVRQNMVVYTVNMSANTIKLTLFLMSVSLFLHPHDDIQ